MKEIKDYLHLYLGCEYLLAGKRLRLDTEALNNAYYHNHFSKITLILRPLSDMDKNRFAQLVSYEYFNDVPDDINGYFGARAQMIKELLDEHFDLFGLIEAGFAIDKTKLKQ